ncbi:MAG: glycoside hydrolase family 9 protein [Ignavibacteriaceae bacterium]
MRTTFTIILSIFLSIFLFGQDVRINQVGYSADQQKLAYLIQPADSFYIVNSSTKLIQFRGKLEDSGFKDGAVGFEIYYGDFSSFTEPGNYEIQTNDGQISYPFEISANPFTDVYKETLKGFYYQRCGTALLASNAGSYAHPACHLNDANFEASTGLAGYQPETGGWHDAGDYGKYVVNAGITVGTLLMGYEMFPDNFKLDDLNIPESGNSTPDLLDEVKYELDWLLKMQDSTDGGIFFKVTPKNFSGFIMPNNDNSTRYIYQKSSTATGDFAAVMAMAARIYPSFDTVFASKCLNAAKEAWNYLQTNSTIVPTGGFHNPSGTNTGEYGDGNDSDERLWAASELFITTGDSVYESYFSSHYQNFGLINSTMGWGYVAPLAHIDYLVSKQPKADSTIKSKLKTGLINYCTSLYNVSKKSGFNAAMSTGDYYWGSNSVALNRAVIFIYGYQLSDNINFYNAALDQFNYILGCNIKGISFVTGLGTEYPMHPHHRPSASDGVAAPVPGLVVGGPDKGLDDAVLQAMYTTSTPPAFCYADDQGSYASNEIAINWNAPLVFVAGYFSGKKELTGINEKVGALPGKIQLEQNYPNPFNPSTTIRYHIANNNTFVELKVFNVLGKEIKALVNEVQNSGIHEVRFNASNYSSGIYFYTLKTVSGSGSSATYIATKKMILLK